MNPSTASISQIYQLQNKDKFDPQGLILRYY